MRQRGVEGVDQGTMTAFATCFWIGIVFGYLAKKRGKSFWLWGALGFFIFGPALYIGVVVLMAFLGGRSA